MLSYQKGAFSNVSIAHRRYTVKRCTLGRVQGGFGLPPKTPPFSPFLLLIRGMIVNGTIVDCTAVGFFLKIRKEMGKTWSKSFTRASHTCEASLPSLAFCFQPRSRPFV